MMNFLNQAFENLEHALRTAYYAKEHTAVGNRWRLDVMRDIRHLGALTEKATTFFFVDRLVWRFATAACVLVLMLSVYAGARGFNPLDELANVFFGNPVEYTLTQVLGDE